METERLIIDRILDTDKEDYFYNISHDKKVLETFICRYAESLEDLDISTYLTNEAMFAIRLKETGKLIGIILYFDEKEDSCEASFFTGNEASRHVMEKCGMTYSHFSEKELSYLGVERDLIYYSLDREKYRKPCCETG